MICYKLTRIVQRKTLSWQSRQSLIKKCRRVPFDQYDRKETGKKLIELGDWLSVILNRSVCILNVKNVFRWRNFKVKKQTLFRSELTFLLGDNRFSRSSIRNVMICGSESIELYYLKYYTDRHSNHTNSFESSRSYSDHPKPSVIRSTVFDSTFIPSDTVAATVNMLMVRLAIGLALVGWRVKPDPGDWHRLPHSISVCQRINRIVSPMDWHLLAANS